MRIIIHGLPARAVIDTQVQEQLNLVRAQLLKFDSGQG